MISPGRGCTTGQRLAQGGRWVRFGSLAAGCLARQGGQLTQTGRSRTSLPAFPEADAFAEAIRDLAPVHGRWRSIAAGKTPALRAIALRPGTQDIRIARIRCGGEWHTSFAPVRHLHGMAALDRCCIRFCSADGNDNIASRDDLEAAIGADD
jgi:hypothetical protein